MVFSSKLTPEVLAASIRSQEAVKTAASVIRKALQDVNCNHKDKFFDASELKESWDTTKMPDALITFFFFSSLFNISKTSFLQCKYVSEENASKDNESIYEQDQNTAMNRKAIEMFSLFQIMYYELHHCQKKTPLHLMTGHAIY